MAWATLSGPGAGELAAMVPSTGLRGVDDLGDGRWLVRAEDHQALCDALAQAPRPRAAVRVVVDPTDV